jgi:uncharacterized protein (DUF1501 family)
VVPSQPCNFLGLSGRWPLSRMDEADVEGLDFVFWIHPSLVLLLLQI